MPDQSQAKIECQAQAHWDFMTPEERCQWAWLAGIIDGEGTITIVRHKRVPGDKRRPSDYFQILLEVTMTHKPTIERIKAMTSSGSFRETWGQLSTKPAYHWVVTDRTAGSILRCLLHFLLTKKEQAICALEFLNHQRLNSRRDFTPAEEKCQKGFWLRMRELNHGRGS